MYQGTYHYVQRLVATVAKPDGEPHEMWVDVPFADGTVWRSRRFVTAANHADHLRAQDLLQLNEPENYRVVKRTYQQRVINPLWFHIEQLTGVDPEAGEIWERVSYTNSGGIGTDWRCRSMATALSELAKRTQPLSDEARFRIINPDGNSEGVFTRHDVIYADGSTGLDEVEAEDDDDETNAWVPKV